MAHHGLQCGFCTPGFLMLAANTLERNPDIGDEDLLDVLSSNLCRCTGYQNIIKAVRAAQAEMLWRSPPRENMGQHRPQSLRVRGAQTRRAPHGSFENIICPPIACRFASTTSFGVA